MSHLYSEVPLAGGLLGQSSVGLRRNFLSHHLGLIFPHFWNHQSLWTKNKYLGKPVSQPSFLWLTAVFEAPLLGRPHWVCTTALSTKEGAFAGSTPQVAD